MYIETQKKIETDGNKKRERRKISFGIQYFWCLRFHFFFTTLVSFPTTLSVPNHPITPA